MKLTIKAKDKKTFRSRVSDPKEVRFVDLLSKRQVAAHFGIDLKAVERAMEARRIQTLSVDNNGPRYAVYESARIWADWYRAQS